MLESYQTGRRLNENLVSFLKRKHFIVAEYLDNMQVSI